MKLVKYSKTFSLMLLLGTLLVLASMLSQTVAVAESQKNQLSESVSYDQEGENDVPEVLKDKARQIIAERGRVSPDEIKLTNSAKVVYELQKVTTYEFKAVDPEGEVHGLALDHEGNEIDPERLEIAEQAAYQEKYQGLEPALAELLRNTRPNQLVEVVIWLKESDDLRNEGPQRPNHETKLSEKEVENLLNEVAQYRATVVKEIITPVAEKVAKLGYRVTTGEYSPVIYVSMKPDDIRKVGLWEEVDTLYIAPINKPDLDVARQDIGADVVHNNGITGDQVQVGIIEAAGGISPFPHPFLPNVEDNLTCGSGFHATGVTGIVGSNDGTNRGIAPDSRLWVGGSCSGSTSQLQDDSEDAADWGARVLNLSWGANIGLTPGANDRFYDNMVINLWRTVIKSAGNRGTSGCPQGSDGNISSPGLAYNVITVGNYDDSDTSGIWTDDTINPCSSWRDPSSSHNDREKPEVAAPGTDINSTTTISPFVGLFGSGTSAAAPMVTGQVALMIQSNPILSVWPEANKAIVMATAMHNIEGNTRLSEFDGAGGIMVDKAVDVANRTQGDWGGMYYSCSTPTWVNLTTANLTAGHRTRAVIAWDTNTTWWNWSYGARPSADLDLQVVRNGTVVASSSSWDNTYEVVDFTPTVTGNYTLRVRKYRCNHRPKWLGWAWHQDQDAQPQPQPPVARCKVNPAFGFTPVTATFDNDGSYDPNGSIVNYSWAFTGGHPPATGAGPHTRTFVNMSSATQIYFGTLTVTDNDGLTDSAICSVEVMCKEVDGFACMH